MAGPHDIDPRTTGQADVRPVVAVPGSGLPRWVIAAGIVLAALLLFSVLDARRRAAVAPAVKPRAADLVGAPSALPDLFVPPAPMPVQAAPLPRPQPQPAMILPPPPSAPPQRIYSPPPMPMMQPVMPQPAPAGRARAAEDSALVYDATAGDVEEPAGAGAAAAAAAATTPGTAPGGRSRATVMRNRPTTVPQGTLIPAVLETAFDSTRPGLARALVSRDVRGFDGSRVLIPRGSRLIGQYQADLQPGQNRALVNWTRLVRPDGVTIAIGSPAADPLGRIGVRGKVNSHFFERFGAAILQTALDIGVNLARNSNTERDVIIAMPGTMLFGQQNNAPIQPTLKVKQGAAITVFVARDLDFTSVEARR